MGVEEESVINFDRPGTSAKDLYARAGFRRTGFNLEDSQSSGENSYSTVEFNRDIDYLQSVYKETEVRNDAARLRFLCSSFND